jgi:hypothetical protein
MDYISAGTPDILSKILTTVVMLLGYHGLHLGRDTCYTD